MIWVTGVQNGCQYKRLHVQSTLNKLFCCQNTETLLLLLNVYRVSTCLLMNQCCTCCNKKLNIKKTVSIFQVSKLIIYTSFMFDARGWRKRIRLLLIYCVTILCVTFRAVWVHPRRCVQACYFTTHGWQKYRIATAFNTNQSTNLLESTCKYY